MCRYLFLDSQGCTFFCWGVHIGARQGESQSRLGAEDGAREPCSPQLCLLQRANPFLTSLSLLAPDQVSTLAGGADADV